MAGALAVVNAVIGAAFDAERLVGHIVAQSVADSFVLFLEGTAAGFAAAAGLRPLHHDIGAAAAVVGVAGTGGDVAFQLSHCLSSICLSANTPFPSGGIFRRFDSPAPPGKAFPGGAGCSVSFSGAGGDMRKMGFCLNFCMKRCILNIE